MNSDCEVQTLSTLFLMLLDWFLHKARPLPEAPFGTMSEYEHIIDHEITHKLLTVCYAQHGDPRAHEKFAEGLSNCTSFILPSDRMVTIVLTLSICFW